MLRSYSTLCLARKCSQLQSLFSTTSLVCRTLLLLQLSKTAENACAVRVRMKSKIKASKSYSFLCSAFKREKVPLKIAEPLSITQSGYEYGLSVVVNQRVDDYSHTVQDLIGTNVYMLDSTIYLDEFSGSVVSRLMQPNEELYISLDAFVVSGSDDMRPYEPHLRPCFFSDETGLDKYVVEVL